MITAQNFKTALLGVQGALGGQVASLGTLADGANQALLTAPETLTVKGAAAFLATMSQESASFRTTEEYNKNGRYKPYIGRTFEQVTWRDNYALFGKWCVEHGYLTDPDYFVKNYTKLADLKWAWLGGIWFWEKNGIWDYADDFLKTQKAVNLGNPNSSATPVGYSARYAWYKAWLQLGDALLPDRGPVTDREDFTHGFGGVLSLDTIPNEWTDKDSNPTVSLNTSTSRLDAEHIRQGVALETLLKQLNAVS